ncbi:fused MFS/spermidine synthase [Bizionia sediminis]|uniref:Fused MFS/spermidine synthase n=1 Tax=Bizionia sediminis TaxID=1737064 RepID=A0ABW5KSQ6_9FLAO
MLKFLSYLYPITTKVASAVSGNLEITWYNGKKYLNTKNANYSYGSLQEILKFGLKNINLAPVNSVLVLGLGGGSVVQTLREDFNYQKAITAVDIDATVIKIAKEEFQIAPSKNLHIVCEDARIYVANTSKKFDLIIIDIFIDTQVPKQFLSLTFWKAVLNIASPNAAILFNAAVSPEPNYQLETIISFLKTHMYQVAVHKKVLGTNTLVIGKPL